MLRERIWVKELAEYLHYSLPIIHRFAKRQRLTQWQSMGAARAPRAYVNPWAAMRIIAYVRACQGDEYLHGKDFHRLREKMAEGKARSRALNP